MVVVPAIPLLNAPIQSADEGLLLVHGEQVRSGLLPLRDFFTFYASGSYRALILISPFETASLMDERILGTIYRSGIVVGTAVAGSAFSRRAGFATASITAVAFSIHVPVAFAWFGAACLILWGVGLATQRQESVRLLRLSAFMVGLASFWRVEAGMFLVSLLPFMRDRRRTLAIAAGAAVGLTPLAIESLFVGPGLVFSTVIGRIGKDFQLARELIQPAVQVGVILAAACSIGLLVASWVPGPSQVRSATRSLGLAGVIALPQVIQRTDIDHLTFILPLSLAPGLAFFSAKILKRTRVWRASALSIMSLIAAISILSATASLASPVHEVSNGGRSLGLTPQEARPVSEVLHFIDRKVASDRMVFVGAKDMSLPSIANISIYYLMPDHRPTFYFTELAPGYSEAPGSRLTDDLRQADALILQDLGLQARFAWPHIPQGSEAANQLVERDFCEGPKFGMYEIYFRKGNC